MNDRSSGLGNLSFEARRTDAEVARITVVRFAAGRKSTRPALPSRAAMPVSRSTGALGDPKISQATASNRNIVQEAGVSVA